MDAFRTVLPPRHYAFSIEHSHQLLCMGSCFAEHIGTRLLQHKFPVLLNPFGILYNPYSIAKSLQLLLTGHQFTEADIFEYRGRWNSFMHHGRFSAFSKEALLQALSDSAEAVRKTLNRLDRLLLTFGTAQVFVYKPTGEVVANCHKLPGTSFDRRRLSLDEILEPFQHLLKQLQAENPDLQVVLTVSPVRHIRDGLIENQRSKALLLLACEALTSQFDFVHYFPAYELVLDDLRDYRFYKQDMIHPSEQAIDYVWEYFANAFFSPSTAQVLTQIHKVHKALQHEALFPGAPEFRAFVQQQLEKIAALEQQYPYLDWQEERAAFLQKLF